MESYFDMYFMQHLLVFCIPFAIMKDRLKLEGAVQGWGQAPDSDFK